MLVPSDQSGFLVSNTMRTNIAVTVHFWLESHRNVKLSRQAATQIVEEAIADGRLCLTDERDMQPFIQRDTPQGVVDFAVTDPGLDDE